MNINQFKNKDIYVFNNSHNLVFSANNSNPAIAVKEICKAIFSSICMENDFQHFSDANNFWTRLPLPVFWSQLSQISNHQLLSNYSSIADDFLNIDDENLFQLSTIERSHIILVQCDNVSFVQMATVNDNLDLLFISTGAMIKALSNSNFSGRGLPDPVLKN